MNVSSGPMMGDRERVGYERSLRSAVLAGDEVAWRAWYDAHADDVRRYAHWRCGGMNDLADDVVQETWLTAVRKIRSFDPAVASFRAWVCGIVGGIAANAIRKHRRTSGRRQVLVEVPAGNGNESSEDRAWLTSAALAELNARHEQVLRAKYLDGESVNGIAENWNESPKAIESLLTRARDAFREAYTRLSQNNG